MGKTAGIGRHTDLCRSLTVLLKVHTKRIYVSMTNTLLWTRVLRASHSRELLGVPSLVFMRPDCRSLTVEQVVPHEHDWVILR